eukprot:CAMPEP_0195652364 /NCGR_PEP_ID=MMETSP0815-20121206/32799_1 /TAXON_ID=97485 /ORGANISM="Prymnesium parvum, Strain Texoma1" /LENGTH=88 /DNA_ID=CAMNT_0040796407 /DNA_START=261 /DNA_END=527 /DNA_ORIENTATION=+
MRHITIDVQESIMVIHMIPQDAIQGTSTIAESAFVPSGIIYGRAMCGREMRSFTIAANSSIAAAAEKKLSTHMIEEKSKPMSSAITPS